MELPESVRGQEQAIDGLFRCLTFDPPSDCGGDYEGALDCLFDDIKDTLDMYRGQGCKFFIGMDIEMSKLIEDDTALISLRTKASPLLAADDSLIELTEHRQKICAKADDFVRNGSGWVSHKVEKVYLYITK